MKTISNEIITNETPPSDAYGLVVRVVGGGSGPTADVNIASVGGTPVTDPLHVIVDSSPPVGVTNDGTFATPGRQDTGNATLASILAQLVASLDTTLSSRASEATLASILAQLIAGIVVTATDLDIRNLVFATDKVDVTGSSVTANAGTNLNTSALNLEATQTAVLARLTSILAQLDVALSTRSSEATLLNVLTTAAFQARINTLGQKAMAASTPVVVASDQSAIPVTTTPSGTQDVNLTKVGGAAIDLGQEVMVNSIPVVIAQDQAAFPVTISATPDASSGVLSNPGDTVVLSILNDNNTMMIQVSGPCEGIEFVIEGKRFFGPTLLPFRTNNSPEPIFSSGPITSSSINNTFIFYCNVLGFSEVQLRCISAISGSAVVFVEAAPWDGPKVQYPDTLVSDAPPNYSPNERQPLSLTSDGRLRVSSVDASIEKVWQNTFNNPWGPPDFKVDNPSYGSGVTLAFTSGDLYV